MSVGFNQPLYYLRFDHRGSLEEHVGESDA